MKDNLKNPNIIINLHSLDKISAELESVAANEGLTKIEALAKKLSTAISDASSILCHPEDLKNRERILKKYQHNIQVF
jgi:hypothetical protein